MYFCSRKTLWSSVQGEKKTFFLLRAPNKMLHHKNKMDSAIAIRQLSIFCSSVPSHTILFHPFAFPVVSFILATLSAKSSRLPYGLKPQCSKHTKWATASSWSNSIFILTSKTIQGNHNKVRGRKKRKKRKKNKEIHPIHITLSQLFFFPKCLNFILFFSSSLHKYHY